MSTESRSTEVHAPAHPALPGVVATYLTAANDGRIEDAAACFAEDARVHDEDRDHHGREAIRQWIAEATRAYQPRNKVLSVKADGDAWVVDAEVSGNFPGSPAELTFRFVLASERISRLTIQ